MLQQNFRNDAHRADSLLAGRARANAGARHSGRPTAVARALGTVSSYVLRREDGQSKQVAKLARLARHGGVRCGYGLMQVKNGYSSISFDFDAPGVAGWLGSSNKSPVPYEF